MNFTTTLSSKGQFTIPQLLRAHLGIFPGDKLLLDVHEGTLIIRALGPSIAQTLAGSLRRFVPPNIPAKAIGDLHRGRHARRSR
jgi:AbrB family looped-hinge helix DNA binding protein